MLFIYHIVIHVITVIEWILSDTKVFQVCTNKWIISLVQIKPKENSYLNEIDEISCIRIVLVWCWKALKIALRYVQENSDAAITSAILAKYRCIIIIYLILSGKSNNFFHSGELLNVFVTEFGFASMIAQENWPFRSSTIFILWIFQKNEKYTNTVHAFTCRQRPKCYSWIATYNCIINKNYKNTMFLNVSVDQNLFT